MTDQIPSTFDQRINARIAELEAEVQQLVQQANAAIAARQGQSEDPWEANPA